MGTIDRAIRILIAIAIGVLFFTNEITGITAMIVVALAVVLLVTSLVGFCPLYALLLIKTVKKVEGSPDF